MFIPDMFLNQTIPEIISHLLNCQQNTQLTPFHTMSILAAFPTISVVAAFSYIFNMAA